MMKEFLVIMAAALATASSCGVEPALAARPEKAEEASARENAQAAEEVAAEMLVRLEGSVKRNGMHVTYDDATGKPCSRELFCQRCGRFVDGSHRCPGPVSMKWRCKGVPTIGYGTTAPDAVALGSISEDRARELLRSDLAPVISTVREAVTVEITEEQVAALASFTYNVGRRAFLDSTLLKVLNEGRYDEVPAQLRRWNRSGGRVVKGLVNRREHEAKVFMGALPK